MIKFLDLHKINQRFEAQFQQALKYAMTSGQYVLGANVSAFEEEFAHYCGTKHCIGVANGLDALTLILKGYIHLGKLKKGDHVLVPSNTFIATILSVLHAGLNPVFVEPNPKTYNLDKHGVKESLSREIKAIIIVHLYGQLADVEGLRNLSRDRDILLIADAAQSHGAQSKLGKSGSLADAAAFSFYPSKNLGALGDGGAVTTNDTHLADVVRLYGNYGSNEKYVNKIIGHNSRLDDIQAAFLSVKLKLLDKDNARRRQIAKRYISEIKNPKIELPYFDGSDNHVFYAFVIEVENRSDFQIYLKANDVGCLIHYPIPPHKQQALKQFSELELSVAEQIHKRVVSLPISPVMKENEVDAVIKVLNAY
ncbi:DegT/DnrJ/EryC1/StrS family aminotransferase [Winogradskyella sp. DF17]|uniref:DegT/DnrJ/EryC1/StrS family aminotransferase n=1 Tax=Winogradskyella pelagia TaxID=2819984 RepID=A0ABS3T4G3_9FLAO|nr:DegT/DnrJ/EryC1/StrS family aminotransferase [Winogradskyella sp. DF17]MBO3117648.1 DegT/DnrJ/EryC1/StrS family aminotransferase [Winogradskyella sp. DF17]